MTSIDCPTRMTYPDAATDTHPNNGADWRLACDVRGNSDGNRGETIDG
jgi:hypothetical protein